MRPDDVVILLDENGGTDSPYVPLNRRLAVRPSDFLSEDAFERARVPAERGVARRAISIRDREFVLTAVFGRVEPAADVLAETNRVLASLSVESGGFYPGRVEPGGFDAAPGWFWGSGERTAREAWGEHGALWASTRPLGSDPIASWPDRLRALAPDDVFVLVWLSRIGPEGRWAERPRPYRLADAKVRQAWKGQPSPNVPEHLLLASAPGGIDVELRVYFGRPDPTPAQREAADAQLARLRLPDWGSWELE